MTFQEALISLRDPNGNASPEGLALAEQVEANRKLLEAIQTVIENQLRHGILRMKPGTFEAWSEIRND